MNAHSGGRGVTVSLHIKGAGGQRHVPAALLWELTDWWLIVFWVRDLTAPMHLGLNWPFVAHVQSEEPRSPTEFPDGPQIKGALLFQQGPDT